MKELKRNADVLEFFENFYAGFLQILLQTYLFIGRMDWVGGHKVEAKPCKSQMNEWKLSTELN